MNVIDGGFSLHVTVGEGMFCFFFLPQRIQGTNIMTAAL